MTVRTNYHFRNSNSRVSHIANDSIDSGADTIAYCGTVCDEEEPILYADVGMNMQGKPACKRCLRCIGGETGNVTNREWPGWKRGFDGEPINLLVGEKFKIVEDLAGGQPIAKRNQGKLSMCVYQDNTAKPQASVRVSWEYLSGPTKPTKVSMTDKIWRMILDGFDNSTILINSEVA